MTTGRDRDAADVAVEASERVLAVRDVAMDLVDAITEVRRLTVHLGHDLDAGVTSSEVVEAFRGLALDRIRRYRIHCARHRGRAAARPTDSWRNAVDREEDLSDA
jgi:hypothetical protein